MRKSVATILSFFTLSALALPTAAGLVAPKNALSASADGVAVSDTATTIENGLIVPQTYEEYLALHAPSDVAVGEDFTAIADENNVYVYDRTSGVYRKYENTPNADPSKNFVTKLQFDDGDNLYFLDAATNLYRLTREQLLSPETATAEDTNFTCSTFIIQGDALYFTNVTTKTQLSKASLSNLDKHNVITLLDDLSSKPTLAFWNGELYYTNSGKYLNKLNPEATGSTGTFVAAFPSELVSMAINGGSFACSDIDGKFTVYDLTSLGEERDATLIPPLFHAEESFSSLAAFGAYVYTANGNKIQRYDVENKQFDDFEICDSSSALNRLNGATQTLLCEDVLYIADGGNNRVSAFDTSENQFLSAIDTAFSPVFLATDNDTLVVADGANVAVYDVREDNYGAPLWESNAFSGTIAGVVNVYGKYYIATESNHFYLLETQETENPETQTTSLVWEVTADVSKTYARTTELLCADVYGYLYTVSGNDVYRYTETEFLDPSPQSGTKIEGLNFPTSTSCFALDYEQNFYALAGSSIYRFDAQADGTFLQTNVATDTQYVYGETNDISSFTFGIEENRAYVLYNGNYVVQTDAFQLPTVKNIAVNGVDESIFSATSSPEFCIVQTDVGALSVRFDISALQGADVFPYQSYVRETEEKTALKIGETETYNILAHYDETQNRYFTYLVRKHACQTLDESVYRTAYSEEEQVTAWLTNALSLYKFPYLCENLTLQETLPRGAQVTLLGEISRLDHEYYHIRYTAEDGTEKTGYIPKVYATLFDASPKNPQTNEYGGEGSNRDALWRTAYILLGFGAICILTDFLLLRNKKED